MEAEAFFIGLIEAVQFEVFRNSLLDYFNLFKKRPFGIRNITAQAHGFAKKKTARISAFSANSTAKDRWGDSYPEFPLRKEIKRFEE